MCPHNNTDFSIKYVDTDLCHKTMCNKPYENGCDKGLLLDGLLKIGLSSEKKSAFCQLNKNAIQFHSGYV